jgi:Kelch motif protein
MKLVRFSQQTRGRLLTGALVLGAATVQANHVKSPGMWTPPCPAGLVCMLEGREGFAMTQIANQLVVSHGFTQAGDNNDTRIYDMDTNTWFDPAPVPPPSANRSELAGAAHGALHYAVGGRGVMCVGGVCADLEVYDPVANTWSALQPMPTPRAGLAAVAFGDRIYAIGGRSGFMPGIGPPLDAVEAYDIDAAVWVPLAPLPFPVMDTAATAIGGKIYVIGVDAGSGAPMNTVQIYNIAYNTWSLGQPMPTARANLAVATCGIVIVATGGRTTTGSHVSNSNIVEAYEIPHNQWVANLNPMPTAKSEHSSVSHGNLLFATGSGIFGAAHNYHEALTCSSLYGE